MPTTREPQNLWAEHGRGVTEPLELALAAVRRALHRSGLTNDYAEHVFAGFSAELRAYSPEAARMFFADPRNVEALIARLKITRTAARDDGVPAVSAETIARTYPAAAPTPGQLRYR
jgi:hypothetical protein